MLRTLHIRLLGDLSLVYGDEPITSINAARLQSLLAYLVMHRDANFAEVIVGVAPDPANNDRMIQWAKDYWLALHPYSSGGAYVNMMMDEGQDQVKAAYRDNHARLVQTKAKYDPTNLFHVNQNIKPTV